MFKSVKVPPALSKWKKVDCCQGNVHASSSKTDKCSEFPSLMSELEGAGVFKSIKNNEMAITKIEADMNKNDVGMLSLEEDLAAMMNFEKSRIEPEHFSHQLLDENTVLLVNFHSLKVCSI